MADQDDNKLSLQGQALANLHLFNPMMALQLHPPLSAANGMPGAKIIADGIIEDGSSQKPEVQAYVKQQLADLETLGGKDLRGKFEAAIKHPELAGNARTAFTNTLKTIHLSDHDISIAQKNPVGLAAPEIHTSLGNGQYMQPAHGTRSMKVETVTTADNNEKLVAEWPTTGMDKPGVPRATDEQKAAAKADGLRVADANYKPTGEQAAINARFAAAEVPYSKILADYKPPEHVHVDLSHQPESNKHTAAPGSKAEKTEEQYEATVARLRAFQQHHPIAVADHSGDTPAGSTPGGGKSNETKIG